MTQQNENVYFLNKCHLLQKVFGTPELSAKVRFFQNLKKKKKRGEFALQNE